MSKKAIIWLVSGIAAFLVIIAVILAFVLGGFGGTGEPTPEESQPVPDAIEVPSPAPGEAPETEAASPAPGEEPAPFSKEFWSGDSKAGLCEAMQTWYLDEVDPYIYGSDEPVDLESTLTPAVENGRGIIEQDSDDPAAPLMTELVNKVEEYKNVVPDPSAPQQAVGTVIAEQSQTAIAVKAECGW